MIDFEKISAKITSENTINPSEIFRELSSKELKYSYLRNVQAEVLDQWFSNRNDKNIIIKMNTGSGKTTVGLLILKSCLAEKKGRAVYVVPDNYLVTQVIQEANSLGIPVTKLEDDIDFLTGNAILVINIKKLFNGKSVFGMRVRVTDNIAVNHILIDDVHACVDAVRSQFTIRIPIDSEPGKRLLTLYEDDLNTQNSKVFSDIKEGDPNSLPLAVPFWRINNSSRELQNILREYMEENFIKFSYPLIADILDYCNCTFTAQSIEIEPYLIPIHKITSFIKAERHIFMSATLYDDNQLVSIFDIETNTPVITPKSAADIGDRMILFPQAYSPNITDDDIKAKLIEYAINYNVVIIVPSNHRAEFWCDATENIYTANNIMKGIEFIRSSNNGLYVFVNKYDGIDLPDKSCRIIVLDGLPNAMYASDKLKEMYLQDATSVLKEKIQKIEQGMGRGIRSNTDYCGVIIMNNSLVKILYDRHASSYFSTATKKQYDISSEIAKELKGKSITDIFLTLKYCIEQDPGWVKLSRKALSNLVYEKEIKFDEYVYVCREANKQAVLFRRQGNAQKLISDLCDKTTDKNFRGYLMLEQAKYCQLFDPILAQKILAAALKFNYHLLKPMPGINCDSDKRKNIIQAETIIKRYGQKSVDRYVHELNTVVIDNLMFLPKSHEKFENAFKQLGLLLGFMASQPDKELGIGPDVLWKLDDFTYAIIECKNEATSLEISKRYCEQLLSSVSWFAGQYDGSFIRIPIIIAPESLFGMQASPAADFLVIDKDKLDTLKENLRCYCKAISANGTFKEPQKLSQVLHTFHFTSGSIFKKYTVAWHKK